jgi:hypothetical protein
MTMTSTQRALRAVTIFSCAVILMRLAEIILLLKAYPLFLGMSDGSAVPVKEIGVLVFQSKRLTIVWYVVVLACFASIVTFTSVAYGALRAALCPGCGSGHFLRRSSTWSRCGTCCTLS